MPSRDPIRADVEAARRDVGRWRRAGLNLTDELALNRVTRILDWCDTQLPLEPRHQGAGVGTFSVFDEVPLIDYKPGDGIPADLAAVMAEPEPGALPPHHWACSALCRLPLFCPCWCHLQRNDVALSR